VSHADDEMAMLSSLGLKEKQIMLLMSSQLVQICDDLFEIRQHAASVDPSNKADTATRYAWVNLKALNKMAEYTRDKFKNVFAGVFVRFLTTQIANIHPVGGWQSKVATITNKLAKTNTNVVKLNIVLVSKKGLDKLDHTLENIVRINDLKNTANGCG